MTTGTDTLIYRRADVYHDFYQGRGKDYRGEARAVLALVRERAPRAMSLLDVACGTGAHLRELSGSFEEAAGVDLSPEMLAVAARNNPALPLHQGDMRDFRLGRRFSAVTCMFSSIGYLETAADLRQAVRNLAGHVEPGGVLVVEPWWFPDTFLTGWVGADVVSVEGRTISRVSHSVREGSASRMEVHYTVAAPETGIEHFTDTHVMSLFDRETYEAAFREAGLEPHYTRDDPAGPGVFVAVREGAPA
ncbi:SAM-dependent methyltransferase [Streptomyces solincola]|uniref:SAM-dependent methyltransferase n=1 Tax=Streptomyces solincola TaxID=2100817 RepID=A0A2S9Q1F9_9ACTN|nr:class I SAM-dependent methyltransferase [Streptomyces solincola]PRH80488.1 SAM-dependent methyltransferase [Streptomyces solincola]